MDKVEKGEEKEEGIEEEMKTNKRKRSEGFFEGDIEMNAGCVWWWW